MKVPDMSGEDEPKYLHFEERQRLKARSRQNDEDRLARGEITGVELQRENMPFRKLRRDRIVLCKNKKTGEIRWLSVEPKSGARDGEDDQLSLV